MLYPVGTIVMFHTAETIRQGVYARPALRPGYHVIRSADGATSWIVHARNIRKRTGGMAS